LVKKLFVHAILYFEMDQLVGRFSSALGRLGLIVIGLFGHICSHFNYTCHILHLKHQRLNLINQNLGLHFNLHHLQWKKAVEEAS